jgi:PAS domain S-box-containing protein
MEGLSSSQPAGPRGIRRISLGAISVLAGALVLGCVTAYQRMQLGLPLLISGYIAPLAFGGLIGGAIYLLVELRLHRMRELLQRFEEQPLGFKALGEKGRFHEALLDDMQTFVAVLEPNGDVIFVNNTPLKVGGMELKDVIGKKFYDAPWWTHSAEVHATLKHDVELCRQGKTLVHDVPIQIADGSLMWIEYSMHPIFDAQGRVQFLVPEGRDITDRRLAEEGLRKSEQEFRGLFDHSPISIWREDFTEVARRMEELRGQDVRDLGKYLDENPDELMKMIRMVEILDVNECSVEIHGAESKEHLLSEFPNLFNERALTVFKDILVCIWNGDHVFKSETQTLTLDGRQLDSLIQVHLETWSSKSDEHKAIVTMMDITESKQAGAALAEKERIQQALLDDMQTFVAVLEPNGDVIFVNNTPLKVGGMELKDVIGQKFYDAPWWTHSEEVHETLKQDIELCGRGDTLVHDVQIKIADGSLMWIEYSMHPIFDDEGKVQYLVPEGRDITDRKKLEEQFRQAQKMEAVGQLAGGIAHDFNNLLQVINSYSALALMKLDKADPIHQEISYVAEAGDKAATLVSQILAFSRRQVLDMKDVNLASVISDMMKMLQRLLGENVTLKVLTTPDLGIVRADSGQIEQVLMNLCVNARDAMPDGGTITIKTENVQLDEEFCRNREWADPGSYVVLSVTDTGCGMDEETIQNIFEPFFTTKDVGKGSGLGLSMVYGLVKQHLGLMHIHSEVGKSATFEIYLPATEEEVSLEDQEVELPAVGGTETILFAEDNVEVLRVVQSVLEEAGYSVLTAANGEEAIRIFDEHADRIDMALLDVMMPKLGGRGVYEYIHKNQPDLPFLFASGYSEGAIHTDFILDKGLTLINKPYEHNALLHAVRKAIGAVDIISIDQGIKQETSRILLVDDDESVRTVLKKVLESAGYLVVEADNGSDAIKLYRKDPADFVITDIVMPDKEGLAVIRELKAEFPDLKIIAISGGGRGGSRSYLEVAKHFGAEITLEKPISPELLLSAVSRIMTNRADERPSPALQD